MTLAAFSPQGNTCAIPASSAAPAATQISTGSQQGAYISNPSTQPIYIAFGSSNVTAAAPTTGVPSPGLCLRAGAERTFTIPPNAWMAAATTGGNVTAYATPGFGQ